MWKTHENPPFVDHFPRPHGYVLPQGKREKHLPVAELPGVWPQALRVYEQTEEVGHFYFSPELKGGL